MTGKAAVLILDDEEKFRRYLGVELRRMGYEAHEAADAGQAEAVLARHRVDVAVVDICLPGKSGVSFLRELLRDHPCAQAIMLTGNASVETAVETMKLGAFDYLTKPYDLDQLCVLIDRARESGWLRRENAALRRRILRETSFDLFVGSTPGAAEVLRFVESAAAASSAVLICGETGTGKEIIARMIHRLSPRCPEAFLAVNCSAFQETLLESELFGHEKGAFTDASRQKPGLVELADGGCLFLDEVGDMSPAVQAKLLRFLDSGEYRRLGGTRNLRSDVRALSATHRDLPKAIQEGGFRMDLFYRLNVLTVRIPPLRERAADIPVLAEHFLRKHAAASSRPARRLSPDAVEAMLGYSWPGNVRELQNILERAMILAHGEVISRDEIVSCINALPAAPAAVDRTLAEAERRHILTVLSDVKGSRAKAARILGIDPKTLYSRLKEYGAGED